MNHSSTQVPFVLAAIIAVMIHSVITEPSDRAQSTMTHENQTLKSGASAQEPMLVKEKQ